ncbi:hypothetical protein AAMO2058_000463400 [Amorphochlora amoebiformis]
MLRGIFRKKSNTSLDSATSTILQAHKKLSVRTADTKDVKEKSKKAAIKALSTGIADLAAALRDKEEELKLSDCRLLKKTSSAFAEILTESYQLLDFETRKLLISVCSKMLQGIVFMQYLANHPRILSFFVDQLSAPQIGARNIAQRMVKDICSYEALHQQFFAHDGKIFWVILSGMSAKPFDIIASSTEMVMELSGSRMFRLHSKLLRELHNMLETKSSPLVPQFYAISCLRSLLTRRTNQKLMISYVSDSSNLVRLLDYSTQPKSVTIQKELFNILKLFIANPDKGESVEKLLLANKKALLELVQKSSSSPKNATWISNYFTAPRKLETVVNANAPAESA